MKLQLKRSYGSPKCYIKTIENLGFKTTKEEISRTEIDDIEITIKYSYFIEINTINELDNLSKALDYELIYNSNDKSILIYDDYIE